MIERQPLAPNNRNGNSRVRAFKDSGVVNQPVKSNEKPSIRLWARRGRPTGEGFGGGNRVGY